jgi:hypothetical protein
MLDRDEREFVLQRVLIPPDAGAVFEPLTSAERLVRDGFAAIAANFRRNLRAVLSTASVPFRLVAAAVQHARWQALMTAELIRSQTLVDGGMTEAEAERVAAGIARTELDKELHSETSRFGDSILHELRGALDDPEFAEGASELLRQATVLTWSALEVAAQEIFAEVLNTRPAMVARLSADESAKRAFPLKSIAFEALVEYEFDLSRHMGDLVAGLRAVDSVPMMKTAFSALFPGAEKLRIALGDQTLWTLNQRRHLILHRRGVVDQAYLVRTGEDLDVGHQLATTSSELEAYLRAVVVAGSELLISANEPSAGSPADPVPLNP